MRHWLIGDCSYLIELSFWTNTKTKNKIDTDSPFVLAFGLWSQEELDAEDEERDDQITEQDSSITKSQETPDTKVEEERAPVTTVGKPRTSSHFSVSCSVAAGRAFDMS